MIRPNKILITGVSGFVGKVLLKRLTQDHLAVRSVLRQQNQNFNQIEHLLMPSMSESSDWRNALEGCDVVIHLAARVHVMDEDSEDPLSEFRKTNVALTTNFARQAAALGVKRFIFLSSVKVNGEVSKGKKFNESQDANPQDAYAISKWEAEEALRNLSKKTDMEVVIIRPPLVYGPGVKANFLKMMRYLQRGVPLPLGSIQNKRSLVGLNNLVDFIVTCITHPKAANQTFLISDNHDISTSDLLRLISKVMDKRARLIPIPSKLLFWLFSMIGRGDFAERLLGSLEVDISKAKKLLSWSPPATMEDELKETVRAMNA
jgi:nucleoside-diphosphate-sugar epimerase